MFSKTNFVFTRFGQFSRNWVWKDRKHLQQLDGSLAFQIQRSIPGTPAYFTQARRELISKSQHRGPGHVFFTITSNLHDPLLLEYLSQCAPSEISISQRVNFLLILLILHLPMPSSLNNCIAFSASCSKRNSDSSGRLLSRGWRLSDWISTSWTTACSYFGLYPWISYPCDLATGSIEEKEQLSYYSEISSSTFARCLPRLLRSFQQHHCQKEALLQSAETQNLQVSISANSNHLSKLLFPSGGSWRPHRS